MQNIINAILYNFRMRKGIFILLLMFCLIFIVLGVVTAINFDNGVLPIDLGNVAYIRFLRGGGFGSLIFATLFANLMVYTVIIICGCKKFLLPISFIFYFYLVYSMAVIFTSIIIIYGFFSTIIFLMLLLGYFLIQIAILTAIICEILYCPRMNYFRFCFCGRSNILVLSILYFALAILFCITLFILKNYILLLVF